jgi:uncharacterized protein (TIGR02145 family)
MYGRVLCIGKLCMSGAEQGRDEKVKTNQKQYSMKKDVLVSMRGAVLSAAFLLLLLQRHAAGAQTVIGGENGDASALLELQSTSAGLLLPRMTTAERSAIVDPAAGLMVFNTTRVCVEINLGSSGSPDWTCLATYAGEIEQLNCSETEQYGRLMEGEAASDVTLFVFYAGGNKGLYDGQQLQSTGVTGLTATLLPGSFASGDGSLDLLITGTPVGYGAANFELSIGGQSCTVSCTVVPAGSCGAYVSAGQWKQFMCHNLGANTSADPLTPSWELTGNYYQWGRNPNCFGKDGVDEPNPCSSPVYGVAAPWGNTTANDNAGSISGWNTMNPANDALSDLSKTTNDPCPAGYRIPTKAQWDGVRNTSLNTRTMVGTWATGSTNYLSGVRFGGNFLFLPTTGQRGNSNGSLGFRNSYGYYWSSTAGSASDAAWILIFYTTPSATVNTGTGNRVSGLSVRCIAE